MKFGCCGSLSLALLLLALLETITLVLSQEPVWCQTLRATCAGKGACIMVATGMESSTVRCSIETNQPGDTGILEWYFTRTVVEEATLVNTNNTEKYVLQGTFSQQLVVNNVSVGDDGYYFCRSQNNDIISGTCLEAEAPAIFQTCLSGDHIPQQGCPDTEQLNQKVGESAIFDIRLAHSGRNETCNTQEIQMISLSKVGNPPALASCSGRSCVFTKERQYVSRLNVSRGLTNFSINIILNNLTLEDNCSYTASASIRSNSMRGSLHKNFTLNVTENLTTATPTTSDEPTPNSTNDGGSPLSMNAIVGIAVVMVILVLLLVGLGVVVVILLFWTYKHRGKKSDMYETIKDVFRRDKKKSNGVSLTEPDGSLYQRRSFMEEDKMNLPDLLNSESNTV